MTKIIKKRMKSTVQKLGFNSSLPLVVEIVGEGKVYFNIPCFQVNEMEVYIDVSCVCYPKHIIDANYE